MNLGGMKPHIGDMTIGKDLLDVQTLLVKNRYYEVSNITIFTWIFKLKLCVKSALIICKYKLVIRSNFQKVWTDVKGGPEKI